MSQQEKAAYYNALKQAGVQFSKHYREYSTEELKVAYGELAAAQAQQAPAEQPPDAVIPTEDLRFDAAPVQGAGPELRLPQTAPRPGSLPSPPVAARNPDEMAGQRLNTHGAHLEPLRTDPETGFVWYQEEVRKPAYPKPRGRRILKVDEQHAVKKSVKVGEYTEEFEVAGAPTGRTSEIKITLPSYQVGIYKDPRYPFKVYVYNDNLGFDFFEVNNYYGGVELVPAGVKRKYVENHLCYDMRSVIMAIQEEYRRLQLTGKV
jgi:hypothetical protein